MEGCYISELPRIPESVRSLEGVVRREAKVVARTKLAVERAHNPFSLQTPVGSWRMSPQIQGTHTSQLLIIFKNDSQNPAKCRVCV